MLDGRSWVAGVGSGMTGAGSGMTAAGSGMTAAGSGMTAPGASAGISITGEGGRVQRCALSLGSVHV